MVEPFHLLDCCLVSNGGAAVIVTSAERARDLRQPPVYLWGIGQGHPGGDPVDTLTSGAPLAKRTAFAMAGIDTADVDVAELYDCYTFTVLVTLRGLRVLRQGRGRRVRAPTATSPRRRAAREYRRWTAFELLHVGHDAGVRGSRSRPAVKAASAKWPSATSCW